MALPLPPKQYLDSTYLVPRRYLNRYLRHIRMKLILPEEGGDLNRVIYIVGPYYNTVRFQSLILLKKSTILIPTSNPPI